MGVSSAKRLKPAKPAALSKPAARRIDPVTLTVIQAALSAIGEEMFVALRNTAMSAIIYEVLDMGTGITDPEGELATSGCGIPSFMSVMDKAVRRVIKLKGAATIHPGDLFICNDPYYGGVTHLNDVALLLPVFVGNRLVAWVGNIAHWPDVGGAVPGSMGSGSTDIWQEGIRLPAVRLFQGGKMIEPMLEILLANTRLPDTLRGDLWAGIASVRVGERRIRELVDRYGIDAFAEALADHMRQGEEWTRKGLARLPHGTYERVEALEGGGTWKVKIEIGADGFVVDLRDNPDQGASPYNLSRDGTIIAAQMIFKALTGPDTALNGGALRLLHVLTRPGSIFEPTAPAPHGLYFETRVKLHDLLWHCLAEAIPEYLPAGHFASICSTVLSGIHPDTGRPYTVVEPQVGGWGASAEQNGNEASFSAMHGDTFNCPAEISEARYGVVVQRVGLNETPGGEGKRRGGHGIAAEYRIRAPEAFLSIGYGRSLVPPWGLKGGKDGSPNYVEILRRDGSRERHSVVTHLPVREGEVVRIVTGNGGGYGDPRERPATAIAADIRDGLLTPGRARDVYGRTGPG